VALIGLKGVAAHVSFNQDARELARHLRRVIDPERFDGIAFVNTRPFYGLNLYLDLAVANVQIPEGERVYSKYSTEEGLCTQMKRGEAIVYAVKAKNADRFVDAARECGGPTPRRIGQTTGDGYRILLYDIRR
jgi:hypothetical protein